MSGRNKKRKAQKEEQTIENVLREYMAAQAAKEEEPSPQGLHDDEDETEMQDNGMDEVETYAEYRPSKLNIGAKHPDPVVCTASLASVQSADITYTLKLPERIIKDGVLSALQLEAVTYASQAHQSHLLASEGSQRAGFLIGKFVDHNALARSLWEQTSWKLAHQIDCLIEYGICLTRFQETELE